MKCITVYGNRAFNYDNADTKKWRKLRNNRIERSTIYLASEIEVRRPSYTLMGVTGTS